MTVKLVHVSLKILSWSIAWTTRLLSAPCDESESSSWLESKSFQHFESLKNCNKSTSVIIGTSLWSSIPCINMSTCQNNLLRFFSANDLENQIRWIRIWNKLRFNDKLNYNLLASVLHSFEHFWVFDSNCCTRNFLIQRIILHVSSVHWINTLGCDRSDKHSFGSIFRSDGRSINSIRYRSLIIDPLMIKNNYLTWDFIFSCFQFIKVLKNQNLGRDVSK